MCEKLFLSASFRDVAELLPGFIDGLPTGKRVTFIPTASLHEKVNFYVKAGRKSLEKLGFIVDELEISTASSEEIASKIQGNDVIYISGGNTFFLLQELKRTGADVLIKEQIKLGKLYIGESAGSVIAAPSVSYMQDMDNASSAKDLDSFDALSAVDFYPIPHYTNFPFAKVAAQMVHKYADLPICPISNREVILVEKGEKRVVDVSKEKQA